MASESSRPAALLFKTLRSVLGQAAKPIDVLQTILDQAVQETSAERGLLVEVSRDGSIAYRVIHRFRPEQLSKGQDEFSRTILNQVVKDGRTLQFSDVGNDSTYGRKESVLALRLVSMLCVPIRVDDRVRAIIVLEHGRAHHFTDDQIEVIESLAAVAGPALETMQQGRRILRERERLRASEGRFREEVEQTRETLTREWNFSRFVGRAPAVQQLEEAVIKIARTEFPVLLQGETGTGKSILARVIHHTGERAQQPFVTVFCPSLEKSMVEAELFGHKKGAFTGATADREGKVPLADRGTVFLDEIGELPLDIQAKLLRLLQEKTYEVVGDPREREADVRVIAATNRDLEQEVDEGRFRRDLFERLNFIPLRIPALRERRGDIPLLLRHCLDQSGAGRWVELSKDAESYLAELDFSWPGNVRHLEQLAARLAVEQPEGPLTPSAMLEYLGIAATDTAADGEPGTGDEPVPLELGLPALLERAERTWLHEALKRYPEMNRTQLAAKLKISESSLYKKLRQYRLGS